MIIKGRVGDVVIVGRTPSPYSGTMGAHSTAWIAHVDKVRRSLMNTSKEEGFVRLIELAEGELKSPMLQDKYKNVLSKSHKGKLKDARKDLMGKVNYYSKLVGTDKCKDLTKEDQANLHKNMINSYLFFVNLIPMSTVENGKTTGNSEGASRKNINRYEYAAAYFKPGSDTNNYIELESQTTFERKMYDYFNAPEGSDEGNFRTSLERDVLKLFAVDTPDQFVNDHQQLKAVDVWSDSLSNFFDTLRGAYPSSYNRLGYSDPSKLKDAVTYLLRKSPNADIESIASKVIESMGDGNGSLKKSQAIGDKSRVSDADINGPQPFHADLQLSQDKTIDVVEFEGRTESPFSATMGAHSTAWVAHLDALRNTLTNQKIEDAVNKLSTKAEKALNDESLKFSGLLTSGHQHKLIQAYKKMEVLMASGDRDDPTDYLRNMIESYLNLVNLLPMSTNDVGNTDGKGEGTSRAAVLAIETGANSTVNDVDAINALLGLYDASVNPFEPGDVSSNGKFLIDEGLDRDGKLYSWMVMRIGDSDYVGNLENINEKMLAISIDRFINTIEEAYPRIYNAIGRDKLIEKLVALHRNGGESEYEGA